MKAKATKMEFEFHWHSTCGRVEITPVDEGGDWTSPRPNYQSKKNPNPDLEKYAVRIDGVLRTAFDLLSDAKRYAEKEVAKTAPKVAKGRCFGTVRAGVSFD